MWPAARSSVRLRREVAPPLILANAGRVSQEKPMFIVRGKPREPDEIKQVTATRKAALEAAIDFGEPKHRIDSDCWCCGRAHLYSGRTCDDYNQSRGIERIRSDPMWHSCDVRDRLRGVSSTAAAAPGTGLVC